MLQSARALFVRRLVWNPWNVAHMARHEVSLEEVEEVCHGQPMTSATRLGRLRVVGPTRVGRMLTVILEPEDRGVYYPVTARPGSRRERSRYNNVMGGESI